MIKRFFFSLLGLALAFSLPCAAQMARTDHEVRIPDIPGFLTLKGDMHIHTVFSDGTVWPTNRIDEARVEGLDVLCITDHVDGRLQLQLNRGLFNPAAVDRNTSCKIAMDAAKGTDILVIHGCEITSNKMPPGHINAIFTEDNNPIGKAKDDAGYENQDKGTYAAVKVAKKQKAFLTWNHPNWSRQAPNETVIYKEHMDYIRQGVLNGIEIYNECEGYCKEGHRLAVEHGLTLMSGTDIHTVIYNRYDVANGQHRPMTLIFARERSIPSVREALEHQRTAVFADGYVYGAAELLQPLMDACLVVEKQVTAEKRVTLHLYNKSSIPIVLDKAPGSEQWMTTRHMVIQPFEHRTITVQRLNRNEALNVKDIDLHYSVANFFTDADKSLNWTLRVNL